MLNYRSVFPFGDLGISPIDDRPLGLEAPVHGRPATTPIGGLSAPRSVALAGLGSEDDDWTSGRPGYPLPFMGPKLYLIIYFPIVDIVGPFSGQKGTPSGPHFCTFFSGNIFCINCPWNHEDQSSATNSPISCELLWAHAIFQADVDGPWEKQLTWAVFKIPLSFHIFHYTGWFIDSPIGLL